MVISRVQAEPLWSIKVQYKPGKEDWGREGSFLIIWTNSPLQNKRMEKWDRKRRKLSGRWASACFPTVGNWNAIPVGTIWETLGGHISELSHWMGRKLEVFIHQLHTSVVEDGSWVNSLTLYAFPTCGQSILLRPKNEKKNKDISKKRREKERKRNVRNFGPSSHIKGYC